jgi:hypothetical protein
MNPEKFKRRLDNRRIDRQLDSVKDSKGLE